MKMNMEQKPQNNADVSINEQELLALSQQLTQALEVNSNMRMKYVDDPQKFFDSEEQINRIIQLLSELSQQNLPTIVSSNISTNLIRLLNHPNIDLSIGVVQILYQLLAQQPEDDKIFQLYFRWIVWLAENSCPEALIGILSRIDEQNKIQQYEAGLKCLKLLQTFMNTTDDVYNILGEDRQLMEYLANRIMPNYIVKHKVIDDNKYVSSDVLIQLLSNSQKSQLLFVQFSGIEVLIETIASYETKLPENQDEKEFLNNLFSSLALLLANHLLTQYKKVYHEMKANYLMISFIKMKNQYSSVALKCIANSFLAVDKQSQKSISTNLINEGALKYLFAVFKRKGLRGQDVDEQKAIDESVLLILYAMSRSVTQIHKDRLEYKLIENRFQNLERFFQLRNQYSQIIDSVQSTQEKQQNKTALYLQKLSQGLSLIQTIDKTILVFVEKYNKLKPKIANLFQIYNLKYEQLQTTIKDHYQYIGINQQKAFIESLIANNLLLLKKLLQKKQTKDNQIKLKLQ